MSYTKKQTNNLLPWVEKDCSKMQNNKGIKKRRASSG